MKTVLQTSLLITCVCFLTACGDAETDAKLPEGTAPQSAEQSENTPKKDTPQGERRSAKGLSYVLPAGWSVAPEPAVSNQFASNRVLAMNPPAEFAGAECVVTYWPTGVGTLDENIDRWGFPRFMNLTPQQLEQAKADVTAIQVGQKLSAWIPITNATSGQSMIGIWVPGPDGPNGPAPTWVIKFTGTTEQIKALEPAFKQWVDSIAFENQ